MDHSQILTNYVGLLVSSLRVSSVDQNNDF